MMYFLIIFFWRLAPIRFFGLGERIRTANRRSHNPVLFHLSYFQHRALQPTQISPVDGPILAESACAQGGGRTRMLSGPRFLTWYVFRSITCASVRRAGVEPARLFRHQSLSLACLPFHHLRVWRSESDSNAQALGQRRLLSGEVPYH